jgi:hypothetical protein
VTLVVRSRWLPIVASALLVLTLASLRPTTAAADAPHRNSAGHPRSAVADYRYDSAPAATTPAAHLRVATLATRTVTTRTPRSSTSSISRRSAAKGRTRRPVRGGAPGSAADEVLRPGGNAIGRAGASPGIRELDTADELDEVFEVFRVHGSPTTSRYPGTGFDLPGGGFVGRRESKRFGPTLDINIPGIDDIRKIHVRGQ